MCYLLYKKRIAPLTIKKGRPPPAAFNFNEAWRLEVASLSKSTKISQNQEREWDDENFDISRPHMTKTKNRERETAFFTNEIYPEVWPIFGR